MATPLTISQPGLVLAQSIVTEGIYPSRDSGGYSTVSADALGIIITTAFNPSQVQGLLPTSGQTLSLINNGTNQALYSVIGGYYGEHSNTAFDLPNLSGAAILGYSQQGGQAFGSFQGTENNNWLLEQSQLPYTLGGQSMPVSNAQYAQTLQYIIQINGEYPTGSSPSPYTLGTIYAFAGNYIPEGFAACNGQRLPINNYSALFTLLGTNYGGDGSTYFQVPNLTNALPIGAGGQYMVGETVGTLSTTLFNEMVPGSIGATAGAVPLSTMQPSLALNYIINVEGLYNAMTEDSPMLGQVTMYAGMRPPEGWVLCEGQSLSIADYPALYNLLGTAFGGDGVSTFALPDLRDRTIIGSGTSAELAIGQVLGEAEAYITLANLPEIVVPALGLSLANDSGASATDHVTNAFTLDVLGLWPGAQLQYSTDGQTWTTSYQAHQGANSLWVRQMDVIGQTSQASQRLDFVLDSAAPVTPTVSIEYGLAAISHAAASPLMAPAAIRSTDSGLLTLSGLESGAIISYSTDGGATWSEHFEAVAGINHVQVRQTDHAGNVSDASGVFVFEWTGSPLDTAQTTVNATQKGGHHIQVETPGVLPAGLGTEAVDTVHYGQQRGLSLAADLEDIVLSGLGAGNTVTGNALNNLFDIQAGSWILDGGHGTDTARLDAAIGDYRIEQQTIDGVQQVTLIGPNGKLVLQGIEAIEFTDGTLVKTADALVSDLYDLYQAVLGRNPDFAGLAFWQDALASGATLSSVANSFLNSAESFNQSGVLSTADFVGLLYHDILGRNPDITGAEFWTAQIDEQHASRADVLLGILRSEEAVQLLGDSGPMLLILG